MKPPIFKKDLLSFIENECCSSRSEIEDLEEIIAALEKASNGIEDGTMSLGDAANICESHGWRGRVEKPSPVVARQEKWIAEMAKGKGDEWWERNRPRGAGQ